MVRAGHAPRYVVGVKSKRGLVREYRRAVPDERLECGFAQARGFRATGHPRPPCSSMTTIHRIDLQLGKHSSPGRPFGGERHLDHLNAENVSPKRILSGDLCCGQLILFSSARLLEITRGHQRQKRRDEATRETIPIICPSVSPHAVVPRHMPGIKINLPRDSRPRSCVPDLRRTAG